MNKVIIAGSRTITDYNIVKQSIRESGFKIDEIVCGDAKGVDELGNKYGIQNNIPIKHFPAKWNEIGKNEPIKLKTNKYGKVYNALAGHNRNKEMARYASHLILIHNNSPGSLNMLKLAKQYNLKIYEKIIK